VVMGYPRRAGQVAMAAGDFTTIREVFGIVVNKGGEGTNV
jgi:hypothetical protein